MSNTNIKEALKMRRKRMENTQMDETNSQLDDSAEQHFGSTQDLPSDEDIKEADNLFKDINETHKERTRELQKQFRSRSREDIRSELKSSKARTKARLEASLRSGTQDKDSVDQGVAVQDGGVVEEDGKDSAKMEKSDVLENKNVDKKPTITAAERKAMQRSKLQAKKSSKQASTFDMTNTLDNLPIGTGTDMDNTLTQTIMPTRRFRGQREALQTTRFDEASTLDEKSFRSQISTQPEVNKEMTWEELRNQGWYSEKQSVDFFSRLWEAEAESTFPDALSSKNENAAVTSEDANESTRLLENSTERLYKSSLDFVVIPRRDYTPHETRIEIERDFLFVPAAVNLTLEEKMGPEFQPRNREEEGFYVGKRPMIAKRNEQRLESRFLKENRTTWFGDDGKVKIQPDPLKEVPFRPMIWDDQDNPMPEHLQAEYKEPILIDFENRTSGTTVSNSDACWQLDVDLHSLAFRHHHLFSKEHVLANRLSELIKRLDAAVVLNWEYYCDQRLIALKHAINTLIRQVEDNKDAVSRGNVVAELMTRIREYRAQVTETRRSRNCAGMLRKQLVRASLRTWKQLKRHRQAINCTNTDLVLEIRKVSWSHADDEAAFLGAIDDELSEERESFEEMYKLAVEEYNLALKRYEDQKAAKEAAALREEMREEARQNATAAGQLVQPVDADKYDQWEEQRIAEEILKDQDLAILEEPDLIEPEEPLPFNEAEVRNVIKERASNSRRLPGEPEIQLKLANTATITPDSLCPTGEARRRRSLANFKYFMKIFINHKLVLTTDDKDLGSNFTINYNIIYPIQIFSYPEIISAQLWEKHGFRSRQLSEVTLSTPDSLLTLSKAIVKPFEFTSSVVQKHTHEGIGSGVNFAFDGQVSSTLSTKDSSEIMALSQLLIAGYVTAALGWSEDESGQPLAAPPQRPNVANYADLSHEDPIGALGAVDALDEEKLTKWVLKAELDPNDPNNARLLRLLKPIGGAGGNVRVHAPEYFRLNHEQEKFSFCQDEELQKNPRFRMIMYRDQEKEGFKNISIPLLEKEIPPDIFKDLQDRRTKKPKETLRGFEMRKSLHEQYVARIRAKVLEKARQAFHSKSLKDVVREEEIPGLIALLPAIAGIFKANRPLRPERAERKAVPALNIHAIDVKLLVTLNSARNVPLRKETEMGIVRPYVEVSFQEETQKTSVSSGPNPSWNTELQFYFRPPPHITNLESVTDIVHINLFDEMRMEQVVDQQGRSSETLVRVEKRWLGGFHIPFTTIYLNTSIEGSFRLDTPPLLLGYISSSLDNKEDMNPQLNVFITLDPLIRPPEPVKEKFDSQEDAQQLERAETWLKLIKKQYPDREIKCTVINQNCMEVFITRFLSPLEPPAELLSSAAGDLQKSSEILARYVAHIPFQSDALAFPGLCDIWSTCEQFMHLLQGDEEEHAVLLCNFFLHLYASSPGFQVYLALGRSIPEGASSFVMVHEDFGDHIWLWTSMGIRYDARHDPRCPVRSIGCIISQNQILANVQMSEDPKSLNYDFTNPKFWRPCFKSKEAESLHTIQQARLDYIEPLERDIEDYKFKIEKALRDRFMEWRKGWVTKWNRQLMRQLNSILEKLEKNSGKHSSEIENFLKDITTRYDMCGFPMNMHYLEIEEIVGRVFGTGIHLTNTPGVEFALSVYIKAYRGGVLSIWIYATSLVLKRR